MSTNDIDYYKNYYRDVNTYTGEQWKHTSRMQVFQDWVSEYCKHGDRILDIGCGDAIFSELMPEYKWHGVDINIEKATNRLGHGFVNEHDLMKPPYAWASGYFDAIVCSEVLEHLWDLRVVHKEAKRLLKRDGVYIISTPNHDWLANHLEGFKRDLTDFTKSWTVEHIRNYTASTHQGFLNEVGFVVDKFTGADGHFDPITASICGAVYEGLKGQNTEITLETLHKWAGRGIPTLSHTVILAAKKA